MIYPKSDEQLEDDARIRFHSSYRLDNSGCHIWIRGMNRQGYGKFWYRGRDIPAHRFALYLTQGFDLNSKVLILHKCNEYSCVNPLHLYQGDHRDNRIDAINSGQRFFGNQNTSKTHCIRGHELSGNNLRIDPKSMARICKTCHCMRIRGEI